MKKKIIIRSLLIVILFILLSISPCISANVTRINNDATTRLDRIIVRGFGLFPYKHGNNFTFFALSCSYRTHDGPVRIFFKWVTFRSILLNGYCRYIGPFDMVFYLFGMTVRGEIEF